MTASETLSPVPPLFTPRAAVATVFLCFGLSVGLWGGSVAEVLLEIDKIVPGFSDYLLDERGALRRHVNISVNGTTVIDKKTLSDRVPDDGTIYIFQALTGG